MSSIPSGFREVEHTADWELKAWGPGLASLFEQAARGMYALCGCHWQEGFPQTRYIEMSAADSENLLVKFLSELLFILEQERIAFNIFNILINDSFLQADLEGTPVSSINKVIKAVTYHNLKICQTEMGLEVNIVFDV